MHKVLLLIFLPIIFSVNEEQKDCSKIISESVQLFESGAHIDALEILFQVKTTAEENNWHDCTFLILNNIANNYYALLDYGEALDYYIQAYTIALKELDTNKEMIVLNNIAIIYSKDKQWKKSEEFFQKAYQIAKERKNLFRLGMYAINLGELYNKTGQWRKAQSYFKEALKLLENHPNLLPWAKVGYAKNLLHFKKFKEAKELLLPELPDENKTHLDENDVDTLLTLSEIYALEGEPEIAITYAYQALNFNDLPNLRADVYECLSELLASTGEYEKALKIKDSSHFFAIKANQIKETKLFETNKIKLEIQNYRSKLKDRNIELVTQKKLTYITIVTASLIFIMLFLLLRYYRIKQRQSRKLYQTNKTLLEFKLENSKKIIEEKEILAKLEQEKLKNELEVRNRKLSAKAIYLANRNDLLKSIIKEIEVNAKDRNNKGVIEKSVLDLKKLIKQEDEWNEFVIHFEEVNQGMLSRLKEKHSELNTNDLRFLSYLYMNLSTKEIASILNITAVACRKRKQRIVKKLKLSDKENIFKYLSNI
jgi:tetratricopeptide (TPR) repeat protein